MLDQDISPPIVLVQQRAFTSWQAIRLLTVLFFCWKLLLFSVVALAPGPGYDTSTTLLIDDESPSGFLEGVGAVSTNLPLVLKFVRWDAIYFSQIAQRGYLFEQEWAFGPGFPNLVAFLHNGLSGGQSEDQPLTLAFLGVALSNFCHLLSVLVIYSLSKTIFAQASESRSLIPIATAALHIINPAGAFLLAPYTEALFSFLHISGFQLYFWGLRDRLKHKSLRSDVQILAAGAVFGISTTVRSNGLLSGALFLYDAIHVMLSLLSNTLSVEKCKQLACFGIGGCLVGLGTIIPQWNAYTRYCTPGPNYGTRPWCNDSVPSIYAWVQRHYWNVGLLRYWTVSNLPLFLLAAPTILVLCMSSAAVWRGDLAVLHVSPSPEKSEFGMGCLRRLAMPQALLVIMALLSYHVQIITRLSSAYPLWYIWLISSIAAAGRQGESGFYFTNPKTVVRWMIIYAMMQGALYASFLPPA